MDIKPGNHFDYDKQKIQRNADNERGIRFGEICSVMTVVLIIGVHMHGAKLVKEIGTRFKKQVIGVW